MRRIVIFARRRVGDERAAADVEAIGLEKTAMPVDSAVASADGKVDESLIWDQLKIGRLNGNGTA